MAITIQTYEPKILVAGDTLKWKRKDLSSDYPTPSWALTYEAGGPSTVTISITTGQDGTSVSYLMEVTAQFGYDGRPWARQTLDAVEACLTGRSGNEIDRYMIGDRQMVKMTIEELMVWRSKFKTEVICEDNAERIARDLPGKHLIHARFI